MYILSKRRTSFFSELSVRIGPRLGLADMLCPPSGPAAGGADGTPEDWVLAWPTRGPKNPCFRDSFRSRRFVTLGSVPPWLQASDPGPSSDQVNQDFWGRGQAPVLRRASRVSLVYLQGSECHPWKQATRHETETDAPAPPCSGLSRVFVGLPRTDALSS